MSLSKEPLIAAETIRQRIRELAREIREAYGDEEIVVVAVLVGALHFASDLVRELGSPASLDFIRAKRYQGTHAREGVEILIQPTRELRGKHVLMVEDILDTGVTASAILNVLKDSGPASLRCCTLLDKPENREIAIEADFVGFPIPNEFVVGYGLDLDERFRELSAIHLWETSDDENG